MTHISPRRRRLRTTVVCGAALLAFASGCGSASTHGPGVASLGTTTTAASATGQGAPGPSTTIEPKDALVAYAKCMRDNGITMSDPQVVPSGKAPTPMTGPGSGGSGTGAVIAINSGAGAIITSSGDVDVNSDAYKAASAKCQPLLDSSIGQIKVDPQVQAEQRQQMLDFAKCMRAHGINTPDPVFGDNGSVSVGASATGVGTGNADPSSDAYKAANTACGQGGAVGIAVGPPSGGS